MRILFAEPERVFIIIFGIKEKLTNSYFNMLISRRTLQYKILYS